MMEQNNFRYSVRIYDNLNNLLFSHVVNTLTTNKAIKEALDNYYKYSEKHKVKTPYEIKIKVTKLKSIK